MQRSTSCRSVAEDICKAVAENSGGKLEAIAKNTALCFHELFVAEVEHTPSASLEEVTKPQHSPLQAAVFAACSPTGGNLNKSLGLLNAAWKFLLMPLVTSATASSSSSLAGCRVVQYMFHTVRSSAFAHEWDVDREIQLSKFFASYLVAAAKAKPAMVWAALGGHELFHFYGVLAAAVTTSVGTPVAQQLHTALLLRWEHVLAAVGAAADVSWDDKHTSLNAFALHMHAEGTRSAGATVPLSVATAIFAQVVVTLFRDVTADALLAAPWNAMMDIVGALFVLLPSAAGTSAQHLQSLLSHDPVMSTFAGSTKSTITSVVVGMMQPPHLSHLSLALFASVSQPSAGEATFSERWLRTCSRCLRACIINATTSTVSSMVPLQTVISCLVVTLQHLGPSHPLAFEHCVELWLSLVADRSDEAVRVVASSVLAKIIEALVALHNTLLSTQDGDDTNSSSLEQARLTARAVFLCCAAVLQHAEASFVAMVRTQLATWLEGQSGSILAVTETLLQLVEAARSGCLGNALQSPDLETLLTASSLGGALLCERVGWTYEAASQVLSMQLNGGNARLSREVMTNSTLWVPHSYEAWQTAVCAHVAKAAAKRRDHETACAVVRMIALLPVPEGHIADATTSGSVSAAARVLMQTLFHDDVWSSSSSCGGVSLLVSAVDALKFFAHHSHLVSLGDLRLEERVVVLLASVLQGVQGVQTAPHAAVMEAVRGIALDAQFGGCNNTGDLNVLFDLWSAMTTRGATSSGGEAQQKRARDEMCDLVDGQPKPRVLSDTGAKLHARLTDSENMLMECMVMHASDPAAPLVSEAVRQALEHIRSARSGLEAQIRHSNAVSHCVKREVVDVDLD